MCADRWLLCCVCVLYPYADNVDLTYCVLSDTNLEFYKIKLYLLVLSSKFVIILIVQSKINSVHERHLRVLSDSGTVQ